MKKDGPLTAPVSPESVQKTSAASQLTQSLALSKLRKLTTSLDVHQVQSFYHIYVIASMFRLVVLFIKLDLTGDF